jgi:thymidine phosphorylase
MLLGAGRARLDTPIDLSVGLMIAARVGDRMDEGLPLATIHYNDEARVGEAAEMIAAAYTIGASPVEPPALIKLVLR